MSQLLRQPLTELLEAMRRRELSAIELMEATLRRIDSLNERLGAVVARADPEALVAVREDLVLQASRAVERARPWAGHWPDVTAA